MEARPVDGLAGPVPGLSRDFGSRAAGSGQNTASLTFFSDTTCNPGMTVPAPLPSQAFVHGQLAWS